MSDELQNKLEHFIETVIDLRFQFQYPDFTAGPVELNSSVVEVQQVLTQIEKYLSDATRAKALLDRKASKLQMIWQEVWDKAIVATNKRPTLGEYATGKEKAAEANLAAFNEARSLKATQEMQSFAAEAVDVIRLHYYGLDKIRQDLRKRLDMSQTDYYS